RKLDLGPAPSDTPTPEGGAENETALRGEIDRMREELAVREMRIAELEEATSVQPGGEFGTDASNLELESEREERFRKKDEEIAGRAALLEEQAQEIQAERDELDRDLAEARQAADAARERVAEQERELTERERRLQEAPPAAQPQEDPALRQELDRLKEEVSVREMRIAELEEEVQQAASGATQSAAMLADDPERRSSLEKEFEERRQEMDADLSQRIALLEGQAMKIQTDREELAREQNEFRAAAETAHEQMTAKARELAEREKQAAAGLAADPGEVEELRRELQQSIERSRDLNQQLVDSETQWAAAFNDAETARGNVESVQIVERLRITNDELQQKVAELTAKIAAGPG
ncbi:MAG: hypothetical protein ACRDD1_14385, partial [Planctomycetia bacterium]